MQNVEDLYPLTPMQEGMLFQLLQADGSEFYIEQVRYELRGGVDPDALRAAWEETVQRHPALRTAFIWSGVKQPVQVVREQVSLPWQTHDWRGRSAVEVARDLDVFARASRRRPFDPQRAPGLRLNLFVVDDDRSHLLWEFNHMVLDGWSATLVFDEAMARYQRGDLDPSTDPAPVPFRRYLEWLKRQDAAAAQQYWEVRLRGASSSTVLLDRATNDEHFSFARLNRALDVLQLDQLESFARANRLTVSTLVQGAWAACLARYADQDDVTFGVVSSGRPADLDGVEEIVGMFLCALPLRVLQNGTEPVVDWLRSIQQQQIESLPYEYASPVDIRRWAEVPSTQELFESVLVYQGHPPLRELVDADEGKSVRRALVVVDKDIHEQTHFDLTLLVRPGDELHLGLLYNRNRFFESDMVDLLELVVGALVRMPTALAVNALTPLVPRHLEVLAEANRTTVEHSTGPRSLVTGLTEVIARNSRSFAVHDLDSESTLTYEELGERSDSMARLLIEAGVVSGDAVGVALPRSCELLVALLGVWKVGAAYVPLDAAYPASRLEAMVDAVGMKVVVMGPSGATSFPTIERPLTMVSAANSETPDALPARHTVSDRPAADDQPAVLIFTSGSTGEPKPVELSHRNLMNRFDWQLREYPIAQDELCVAKTTLGFVDHLWEIWGPLLAGAALVMVPDAVVQDPHRLSEVLSDPRVRRITLVPSLLEGLLDGWNVLGGDRSVPDLSWVTVSGEETTTDLARRFQELLPDTTLLNFYGMSEATADVTWFDSTWRTSSRFDRARHRHVPIGKPIDNMTVDVLDRRGLPAPVGVVGRIRVGGEGVALGYRARPDLTNDRFGHDDDPTRRTYDTGDLGRWRPDGLLEFAGRSDQQVKIRGVRVEPNEVVAALRSHSSVLQAAVTSEAVGDVTRLIAFVVRAAPSPTSPDSADVGLRDHARSILPPALVPSIIHIVDAIPLLPNGKIDWANLRNQPLRRPPRDPSVGKPDDVVDVPMSDDEETMVGLWREVLRIEHVDLSDDFFEIGGDSLLAVRLFSAIDRAFGLDLPLAAVFESPTPQAMLDRLRPSPGMRPLDAGGENATSDKPPLFLLADGPDVDGRTFAALTQRLADSATVVVLDAGSDVDDLAVAIVGHEAALGRPADDALDVAGVGRGARAALDLTVRLQALGRRTQTLMIIDGGVTFADAPAVLRGPAPPQRVVFLEPAEPEGPVPAVSDALTKERLDDRSQWSAAAGGLGGDQFAGPSTEVETVLVPVDRLTMLTEPNVSWRAHLMAHHLSRAEDRWTHLVPISAAQSATRRLFAVHGEFGNVVGYRDLAAALGPEWELIGVQASGVHGVRPLHATIEEMATAYLAEVRACQPQGPYLLGGYSSGGTVASEMARQLAADGQSTEAVVWFDHFRHGAAEEDVGLPRLARLASSRLRTLLFDRAAFRQGLERRRIDRMADGITAVRSEWWWEITNVAGDRAEAENLRATLIANNMRNARARYVAPPYSGSILLYEAEVLGPGRALDRGWSDDELTLTRVRVPGDHASLLLAPNCAAIAADLRRRFA